MADKKHVSTSTGPKRLTNAQLNAIVEGFSSESSDFDNDSTIDPDYTPLDQQVSESDEDFYNQTSKQRGSQSDDNCCIAAIKTVSSSVHQVSNSDDKLSQSVKYQASKPNPYNKKDFPSDTASNQSDDGDIRPTARCHQRTGKLLTRKRRRDPSSWKQNVRKRLRQSGQQYVDSRGKIQPARSIKSTKDCSKCKFKCSLNISNNDRSNIFNEFWSLNDDDKRHYFSKTTNCEGANRRSTGSRRKQSLRYFLTLNGAYIRVCKQFYLHTLCISQKRISNYHKSKNVVSGTPEPLKWGANVNRVIPEDVKGGIRNHIQSIPRVESHYCRSSTNKEYLSEGLSINILYDKYLDQCHELGREPGKLHLYRQIFNSEYNIAFHTPKKDRCDYCEAAAMTENPTEDQRRSHAEHVRGKVETKAERDRDRSDKDKFVICFDLQNVFSLPTADVSNFFYRRKLNVYHMTAHCSVNKKGYGALWSEAQNGRSANDIASSFTAILDAIVQDHANDPRVKEIILWSDSCVPQNRNSIFSTAIKFFLKKHPEVSSIIQKFCEPGHSTIQEVDNLHSQIEKVCRNCEIYSPVGLLRMLKKVQRNNPMKIIQMKPEYFKDYQSISKLGDYQKVPYTKVKSLMYLQCEPKVMKYKLNFNEEWVAENVIIQRQSRKGFTVSTDLFVTDPKIATPKALSLDKLNDIKQMLKFMPPADRAFMALLG